MDSNRIDELLNKYWNCETSLEEEQHLHAYFKETNIPEQWKETGLLFRYFEQQKNKSLNDLALDNKLMTTLVKSKQGKTAKLLYNSMRIAAGIAVLVMAGWFVRDEVRKASPHAAVDTYEDPKLAFEETKKALLMISKSFGRAEEQAKKINLFNEAQQEIKNKEKETRL